MAPQAADVLTVVGALFVVVGIISIGWLLATWLFGDDPDDWGGCA